MYEFNELPWNQRQYRGKVKFGDHVKVAATLPDKKGTIRIPTGSRSEVFLSFKIPRSIFDSSVIRTAFTKNPEPDWNDPDARNEGPRYMTADGVDPMSKKQTGHPFIVRKPRPANAALDANSDYYFHWERLSVGHSRAAKLGTTVEYVGTDDEDHGGEVLISELPTDGIEGVRVDLGALGGPGVFIPDA